MNIVENMSAVIFIYMFIPIYIYKRIHNDSLYNHSSDF